MKAQGPGPLWPQSCPGDLRSPAQLAVQGDAPHRRGQAPQQDSIAGEGREVPRRLGGPGEGGSGARGSWEEWGRSKGLTPVPAPPPACANSTAHCLGQQGHPRGPWRRGLTGEVAHHRDAQAREVVCIADA